MAKLRLTAGDLNSPFTKVVDEKGNVVGLVQQVILSCTALNEPRVLHVLTCQRSQQAATFAWYAFPVSKIEVEFDTGDVDIGAVSKTDKTGDAEKGKVVQLRPHEG